MRLGLVLVGVALYASAVAGPRAGKVVRVERKARTLVGDPRQCNVSIQDLSGYCMTAKAPVVGDRIVVLDSSHVIGTVRITEVQGIPDACQQNTSYTTKGVLETGNLSNAAMSGVAIGLIDVALDARKAKIVSVDRTPTGHPSGTDTVYAIDNNNDSKVDLEFIQYACDDAGNASVNAMSICNDVWSAVPGRGLERIRQERVKTCY